MKLKRYTGPDIRQAMSKVRQELGPDAVILSNRQIENGVEIIAATDYDNAVVNTSDSLKSKDHNVAIVNKTKVNKRKKEKQISQFQEMSALNNQSFDGADRRKRSRNADPLSAQNTQSLANHLSNKLNLSKPKVPSWQDAMTDDFEQSDTDLSSPENKIPNFQSDNVEATHLKDQMLQNSTQVSSEWMDSIAPKNKKNSNQLQNNNSVDENSVSLKKSEEINHVWDELSSLRSLLETQLSSLAWSDISKREPNKAKVLKHLLELGLTPEISYQLLENIDNKDSFEISWRKALAEFTRGIITLEDDMIKKGGVFALVGPTGVGKTTTIAKMAARYALKHGTGGIALITTDNYRIGAQEQLRTYGRILGTPVKIANDANELRQALKSLYDKDLVLIDTAGTSQRDIRLSEQFVMLSEGSPLIKSYLVLSASSQQQVLSETVDAYKKVHLDGCVLTKLDESITLGGALTTLLQNKLPLAYVSNGQRVPEDLHLANALELVKKSVAMMNNAQIRLDDNVLELAFGGLAANDLS